MTFGSIYNIIFLHMKKLLTIITDEKPETEENAPEEIEILHTEGKFTHEGFKAAKGKYALLARGDLTCDITQEFFKTLEKNNADILVFEGSVLFRPSVLKSLPQKYCEDKFCAEIFAAYNSSSVIKTSIRPFTFNAGSCETEKQFIIYALDEFSKIKSKLNKEIYTFALDYICEKLSEFYARAILAVHGGNMNVEEIKEIDSKLKENPVLNVTFCKRFTTADLQKIREKNYKINFITANKFKKLFK